MTHLRFITRLMMFPAASLLSFCGCSDAESGADFKNETIPTARVLEFEGYIKSGTASSGEKMFVKGRVSYSVKPAPLLGKALHHLYDVGMITETAVHYFNQQDSLMKSIRTMATSLERIVLNADPEVNLVQRHTLGQQHWMYLGFTLQNMELRFSHVWVTETEE
ncbi:MAG TPA: hypothetical protein VNN76_09825 [Bacteroidota bacterium]|nr:hypothetical protein [Bacteroidota bacterium]